MFINAICTETRALLKQLGREPFVAPFYLAGGSAAALHLEHRVSVDLDFFTPEDDYEAQPLTQALQAIAELEIEQQSRGTLNGRLAGIRVSFFAYPYPLLAPFSEALDVKVASLLDIALMKVSAIGQRGARRDFVDLCTICQSGYSLDDLLRRMPEKFSAVSFPSYHHLRALTYFEDAEHDEPPQMLVPFDWSEAKRFFEKEVRRIMGAL